jgi:hypothetical protein
VTVHITRPGHARIDYEYTLYPVSPDPPWIPASQSDEFIVSDTVTEDNGKIVWVGW